MFANFNKMFLPSSFISLPENQTSVKGIDLDYGEGMDLKDFAPKYNEKKRINKAQQKESISSLIEKSLGE